MQHVHGQGQVGAGVAEGQGRRVGRDQGRTRHPGLEGALPGRAQHARRQVRADQPPPVPAAGQFGQVGAVAAADVGDHFGAARDGRKRHVQHLAGQVHRRMLVRVDGLARGQVGVRLVLNIAQEGPV